MMCSAAAQIFCTRWLRLRLRRVSRTPTRVLIRLPDVAVRVVDAALVQRQVEVEVEAAAVAAIRPRPAAAVVARAADQARTVSIVPMTAARPGGG